LTENLAAARESFKSETSIFSPQSDMNRSIGILILLLAIFGPYRSSASFWDSATAILDPFELLLFSNNRESESEIKSEQKMSKVEEEQSRFVNLTTPEFNSSYLIIGKKIIWLAL
jgi:hypothetical protein